MANNTNQSDALVRKNISINLPTGETSLPLTRINLVLNDLSDEPFMTRYFRDLEHFYHKGDAEGEADYTFVHKSGNLTEDITGGKTFKENTALEKQLVLKGTRNESNNEVSHPTWHLETIKSGDFASNLGLYYSSVISPSDFALKYRFNSNGFYPGNSTLSLGDANYTWNNVAFSGNIIRGAYSFSLPSISTDSELVDTKTEQVISSNKIIRNSTLTFDDNTATTKGILKHLDGKFILESGLSTGLKLSAADSNELLLTLKGSNSEKSIAFSKLSNVYTFAPKSTQDIDLGNAEHQWKNLSFSGSILRVDNNVTHTLSIPVLTQDETISTQTYVDNKITALSPNAQTISSLSGEVITLYKQITEQNGIIAISSDQNNAITLGNAAMRTVSTDVDLTSPGEDNKLPTAATIKSYVAKYGGKIDTISINGGTSNPSANPLPIDSVKNIDLKLKRINNEDIYFTNYGTNDAIPNIELATAAQHASLTSEVRNIYTAPTAGHGVEGDPDYVAPTAASGLLATAQNDIDAIEAVINWNDGNNYPATSSNKLTTEEWVRQAIISSSADFLGTFSLQSIGFVSPNQSAHYGTQAQVEAALEATSNAAILAAGHNDYLFVINRDRDTDVEGSYNEIYEQYKLTIDDSTTPATREWRYVYTVRGTTFDSDQWDAINSGISSEKYESTASSSNKLITKNTADTNYLRKGTSTTNWAEDVYGVKTFKSGIIVNGSGISDGTYTIPVNEIANKSDIKNTTLTIKQNNTTIDTFTANSSVDKSINIITPKVYRYI